MAPLGSPTVALENVTLDFRAGAFSTLLGPSGCGKTTLLRILAGFTTADGGTVWIGEREMSGVPPWRRNIGFVFQNYALWPHMTVFDNIAFGLRLRKLPSSAIGTRVKAALAMTGMDELAGRFPGQLSGGQQQRVALARALVLEPEVLLLDEPLSNLDAKLRIDMRREIRRIQREIGITTIYVTHDQEEALEISDVVVVMSRGRVEQVGTPQEVYGSPQTPFVATFLGTANLLRGQAQLDGHLAVGGVRLPLRLPPNLAGTAVTVCLRPEDLVLHRDGAIGPIAGTVEDATYLGHAWRVVSRVGHDLRLVAYANEPVSVGQGVSLTPTKTTIIKE